MPKDQTCTHSATVVGRVLNTGHFKQLHQNLRATNQHHGATGPSHQAATSEPARHYQHHGATGHFTSSSIIAHRPLQAATSEPARH